MVRVAVRRTLDHQMSNKIESEYLTSAQVRAHFGGVSAMWIWRQTEKNGFPQPIRFGENSRRYWRVSDLLAWEERTGRTGKGKRPGESIAA